MNQNYFNDIILCIILKACSSVSEYSLLQYSKKQVIVNSKTIADVGGNVLGFYGFAAGVSGQSGYRTAANRWNKKREKKKGC